MKALVLGDASCVMTDADAALKLFKPDAIFATNNIGLRWKGHVDVWCTLHPLKCTDWPGMQAAVETRVNSGRNRPELWAHNMKGGVDFRTSDWGGSTGLLAVKIAMEKGFGRIVLAGVPLSSELAHYYNPGRPWKSATNFHRAWRKRMMWLGPRVRSMSGWTRELLGPPTAEWLSEDG